MENKVVKNKKDGQKYTVNVHLRLTDEEYAFLAKKAGQMGCNISTMFRHLAFEKTSYLGTKKACSEEKKSTDLAVKSVRETFKKVASMYNEFVENYKKNTLCLMENVKPQVAIEQSIRTVKNLIEMTLLLQKKVNDFLHEFGQNEVHTVIRDRLKELPEVCEEDTVATEKINKYIYMERISVIGKIEADAMIYVATDGTEKMKFRVVVERNRGRRTKKVYYNVYAVKSKTFDYLKKDRNVFVEGDYDEGDEGDKKVFADNVKVI